MKSPNVAQQILMALGVDLQVLLMGAHRRGRFASNTKKGPGRIHLTGKKEKEGEDKK